MMYLGKDAVALNHMIRNMENITTMESGSYTPTQDVEAKNTWIPHSLGIMPDFVLCIADNFTITASATNYLESSIIYRSPVITQAYSSAGVNSSYFMRYTKTNTANEVSQGVGMVILEKQICDTEHNGASEFRFATSTGLAIILKANVTYRYIIGKFKEVTPNANE